MDGRVKRSQMAEIYYNADDTKSIFLKGRTGETEITEEDLDEWVENHLENGLKMEVKEIISFYKSE